MNPEEAHWSSFLTQTSDSHFSGLFSRHLYLILLPRNKRNCAPFFRSPLSLSAPAEDELLNFFKSSSRRTPRIAIRSPAQFVIAQRDGIFLRHGFPLFRRDVPSVTRFHLDPRRAVSSIHLFQDLSPIVLRHVADSCSASRPAFRSAHRWAARGTHAAIRQQFGQR